MEQKMLDEEIIKKDRLRTQKIERELKNQKRPWVLRRYLNRTLVSWAGLYVAMILIIITFHKPTWNIFDLIIMIFAGINVAIWIEEGIINGLLDNCDELHDLNIRGLNLVQKAIAVINKDMRR
jgi:hypothetical protein